MKRPHGLVQIVDEKVDVAVQGRVEAVRQHLVIAEDNVIHALVQREEHARQVPPAVIAAHGKAQGVREQGLERRMPGLLSAKPAEEIPKRQLHEEEQGGSHEAVPQANAMHAQSVGVRQLGKRGIARRAARQQFHAPGNGQSVAPPAGVQPIPAADVRQDLQRPGEPPGLASAVKIDRKGEVRHTHMAIVPDPQFIWRQVSMADAKFRQGLCDLQELFRHPYRGRSSQTIRTRNAPPPQLSTFPAANAALAP